MGGSESSEQIEIYLNHQRFNKPVINKANDEMIVTYIFENEKEIKEWENAMAKKSYIDKKSLLWPSNHSIQEKGMCGSSGKLMITFGCFCYQMDSEIQNRRMQNNKHLDEGELWYLLYILCSAAEQFHPKQKVGDIRLQNIFLSQTGKTKVLCSLSFPQQQDNYYKTKYNNTPTFLSPEQLQCCRMNIDQNPTNKSQSESFSIGLTMLSASLLHNCHNLYDLNTMQLNSKLLNLKLSELQQLKFMSQQENKICSYSPALVGIIQGLCEVNPQRRRSCLQVKKILSAYQEEIFNLSPFNTKKLSPVPQNDQTRQQSVPYGEFQKVEGNSYQSVIQPVIWGSSKNSGEMVQNGYHKQFFNSYSKGNTASNDTRQNNLFLGSGFTGQHQKAPINISPSKTRSMSSSHGENYRGTFTTTHTPQTTNQDYRFTYADSIKQQPNLYPKAFNQAPTYVSPQTIFNSGQQQFNSTSGQQSNSNGYQAQFARPLYGGPPIYSKNYDDIYVQSLRPASHKPELQPYEGSYKQVESVYKPIDSSYKPVENKDYSNDLFQHIDKQIMQSRKLHPNV